MSLTRTFDILDLYRNQFIDKTDALAGKVNGQWVTYTAKEYTAYADRLSCGLISLGINKGDKVVTISNNRPEWNFFDMALSQIGAIHVPLFTNLEKEAYARSINHCKAKMVVVGDADLAQKISGIKEQLVSVTHFFTLDTGDILDNWKTLLAYEPASEKALLDTLNAIRSAIFPDDCATLIYTSGTTGNSKGVMLSHRNLLSAATAAAHVFQLKKEHRYLSILPICHVGERMGCYQSQISGCSIYYGESLATIAADLQDVKPHGFGAVPRILEKVYDKIVAKGEKLTGVKKKLFFWALNLGLEYKQDRKNGAWYELKLAVANKLIFSKWRSAMGGNVISIGVGGAALQPHLERVFWSAGIKLLNMYGLTETAPIITINRMASPGLKLGTVGACADGVEIKIAADGEILCKGPNVMLGYFDDDKGTRESIVDGWFHTGDVGIIDEDGFLSITDRKKEIFKLSNGKYVSPLAIENKFRESLYIDQLMVIGDGQKFTSALISPNAEALKSWCTEKGINGTVPEKIENPEVKKLFHTIVNQYNKDLGKDEQVKRFRLVAHEWAPQTGELSPTLKLKRKVITEKYKELIAEIFT
ncbi:MAG: long-chain fatty acid--CoA ligase [Bacteroidetes bacterium]|nr:long-chain fatty acid--CoA ligase [Bacteroidota bacterium]